MRQQPLDRLAAGAAAVLAVAALAVYPLYIDKFSNLGVVKFAGVFVLFLLCAAGVGACAAVGARSAPCRYAGARRDPTLWALAAFAAGSTLSTVFSLRPAASFWGLGSYYGGLAMVLFTALGYLCVRAFFRRSDFGFLSACVGVTVILVTTLYVLNIFNVDLIGAYQDTAVVERAQFFSTLGQKDFNAGYLSVALPIVFYYFLESDGRRLTALRAVPAVFGSLALAVVDSDGLLLGIGVAALILVCHRDFTTRQLRRFAFLGASFFAWNLLMHTLRQNVYTQGGTPLLAKFGEPQRAIPGILVCSAIWLTLWAMRRGKTELPLYLLGRAAAVLTVTAAVALLALANLWPDFPSLGGLDNFIVFNDEWGTYRGTAWRIAWGAWVDGSLFRKLFGMGPGMMHTAVEQWAGSACTPRMRTFYAAHNEYLEQLLTTGLIGLAAWVAFLAAHLRRGFRCWSRPSVAPVLLALCSYLAQAAVSIRVSMVFPGVMVLFALLAAFTAGEPVDGPPEPAAPPNRGKIRRKASAVPDGRQARRRFRLRCARIAVLAVAAMAVSGALSNVVLWFLF
ncbi:MAG: O-antigen ligase family protein [Gemmiger sp.]